MKNLYTLLLLVVTATTSLHARVVTSAANGNATNPLTWSCTCIPVNGDTIVVNHSVVLDVDYAYTLGGIRINPGGSVTGNSAIRILGVSGGFFVNDGTLTMAFIAHNGGTFTNNGNITILGSLLVDNAVTFTNNARVTAGDSTYVDVGATLQNNRYFNGGVFLSAGTVNNVDTLIVEDMLTVGAFTHTGGLFRVSGSFYNTGNATFTGPVYVSGDIWNAENITVNGFVGAQTLLNGDSINGTATFINNGTVSLGNSLYNSEDITGSGRFCVVDSTINSGNITGTLDICDLSGGGWDLNVGSEAGTVTHCAGGPCTIGIAEYRNTNILMVPNPANEQIRLQLPKTETGVVEVIDMMGRVVLREGISASQLQLNIAELPQGLYSVVVRTRTQQYNGRFVKE